MGCRDISVIGDTHGCHHQLDLKPGDILIHTGDITAFEMEYEVLSFLDWFKNQPFRYKVFIGGNHDHYLEKNRGLVKKLLPESVIYLENNTTVVDGIKIFGTPAGFYQNGGMAFNYRPGEEMERALEQMPYDLDILVTHVPPRGILDENRGCPQLLEKVNRIRPYLHLFGHIHEARGIYEGGGTRFCNAALSDSPEFIQESGFHLKEKTPFQLNFSKCCCPGEG